MSGSLLGIQIDAVYHTALVFGGIEYFFGAGVQTSYPGATHHGKPMEIIPMGTTHLPMEVILEYLESLKTIYTMEVESQIPIPRRKADVLISSHMICSSTIVTTSQMTSQCS